MITIIIRGKKGPAVTLKGVTYKEALNFHRDLCKDSLHQFKANLLVEKCSIGGCSCKAQLPIIQSNSKTFLFISFMWLNSSPLQLKMQSNYNKQSNSNI